MTINIIANEIVLSFDEADWKIHAGKLVIDFINELKNMVPADQRSYNPDNKLWYIDHSYFDKIIELRDSIFADPNQESLF